MTSWQLLYIAPLLAVAYSDYRRHVIPNAIIYPLAIIGVLSAILTRSPLNLVWGLAGLLVGILLTVLSVTKVGDAKLMGVLGLILGQNALYAFYALFIAFVVGGIIALILTLRHSKQKHLPFGVPLCFASIAVLIWQATYSG